jgi:hypothetical protein
MKRALYSPRPRPIRYELYSSDRQPSGSNVRPMRRDRHDPYTRINQAAYIVLKYMQHQAIEVQRLEPVTDLSGAMAAAIERVATDGWQAEGSADYGSVFIRRAVDRRLLMLTERDPYST